MDGWIKLPTGNFLNLSQACAVVKAGLDGSAAVITQTGASMQIPPQDARALRACLDSLADRIEAPVGADLLGGGN
ncbi:hypothetical protein GALL_513300 [mine drainage metagenome]|uniref:Uncharacterized protein n=1 Tax=mine drainage metagenome TaxID=410659 RepID=A0A1J5PU67_9ZZZZ